MMNEQITLSPELEARVHQAVENFMQGYGCCQSVVAAFADLYGLDDEMAKRIGAGFGGGVGDRKSTRLNSSHGKLSRMPSSA